MEIPRSTSGRCANVGSLDPRGPALRFAEVARRLGAAAHDHGLAVPAFRCPPRTPGADRTICRYPGGTVVSVRLRDRPFATVVVDMVEGVLVANRVAPADTERIRAALHASAEGPVGIPVAGVTEELATRAA